MLPEVPINSYLLTLFIQSHLRHAKLGHAILLWLQIVGVGGVFTW